jgi:ribosomal protein S8
LRAREEKSNSGKIPKKKMFIEITEKMHKEGYTFTWEQVQGMWKTLVTALKKTKDHNNKSGGLGSSFSDPCFTFSMDKKNLE